jgi:hypothetical protein
MIISALRWTGRMHTTVVTASGGLLMILTVPVLIPSFQQREPI